MSRVTIPRSGIAVDQRTHGCANGSRRKSEPSRLFTVYVDMQLRLARLKGAFHIHQSRHILNRVQHLWRRDDKVIYRAVGLKIDLDGTRVNRRSTTAKTTRRETDTRHVRQLCAKFLFHA